MKEKWESYRQLPEEEREILRTGVSKRSTSVTPPLQEASEDHTAAPASSAASAETSPVQPVVKRP